MTNLERLRAAGETSCDLSPGDPLCKWAYEEIDSYRKVLEDIANPALTVLTASRMRAMAHARLENLSGMGDWIEEPADIDARDAARYRWLRDQVMITVGMTSQELCDANIDKIMAAHPAIKPNSI